MQTAEQIRVRRGYILAMGSRTPVTLKDDDPLPVCADCGMEMSQGYAIVNGESEYSWWCIMPECRAKHASELRKNGWYHRSSLKTDPSKILPAYGIPKMFFECTFDSYKGFAERVSVARKWAEKPDGTCLISGGTGAGKTHMAVAILVDMITKGRSNVYFKNIPELMLDLKATFNRGDDTWVTEQDILEKYFSYNVLVLDDLGAEKNSDYTAQTISLIVDRRMRDVQPTLITTNLTLEEIEHKIDARLASRLSAGKVWNYKGTDYRKKRG